MAKGNKFSFETDVWSGEEVVLVKILYIVTRSDWGGAQQHIFDLIEYQYKLGNEVVLATGENGELNNRTTNNFGIAYHELHHLKRSINVIDDVRGILEIVKLIQMLQPDIVHLHSSKAGLLGRIAGLFTTSKVIFTVHGYGYRELRGLKRWVGIFLERMLSHAANFLLFVSEYDLRSAYSDGALGRKYKSKEVIYNGVKKMTNVSSSITKEDVHHLVMIARFAVPKRQDLLIEAVKSIGSDTEVTFVGDGPDFSKYKDQNTDTEHLRFVGFQSNTDYYIEQSDAVALISDFEAFPLTVLEGLSFGKPILASDVGGISEVILNGRNGILVQNNVNDIIAGIKYIFDDEDRYMNMSQEALKTVTHFSKDRMNSSTNNVYLKVMNRNRKQN